MKNGLQIVLRVLGGVFAVLLCALLVLYIIPLTETEDKTTVDGSADWMAALDDDLPLSEVVLPGTHNSATKYVQFAFFSKCQAKDIPAQLEAGYRYLDVRLAVASDGGYMPFALMHGFARCKAGAMPWSGGLYLEPVLTSCYRFLRGHPTETIVFAVKQEHGEESVGDFERLLKRCTDVPGILTGISEEADPDVWLLTDHIPTVGEARGKIVLMRRYEDAAGLGAEGGLPLLWAAQSENDDVSLHTAGEDNGGYTLWVQDRYKYGTDDKWAAFTTGMAAGETGAGALSVNFLSTNGTPAYGHPYRYAKELNARLMTLPREELRGWIIVDFADAPLAEHIYSANFTQ